MIKYYCKNCKTSSEKSTCDICGKRAEITSRLYWCCHCNVPIYTEECPLCKNQGKEFTTDVRPVFPEERLLIEAVMGEPMKYHDCSVWNASSSGYFVNGEKLISV